MKVKNRWAETRPFRWYANFNDNAEWLIPITMIGGFTGEFVVGMSVDGMTDGTAPVAISMVTFPLFVAFLVFGHRFSGVNKIDNKIGIVNPGRYSYNHGPDSRQLVRRIMALPKEDQRLFPKNLVETLSRDLHSDERRKINSSLKDTLDEIAKRNKTRREAEQKAIYTEGVMAALEDARNNVKTEHDILKEYL